MKTKISDVQVSLSGDPKDPAPHFAVGWNAKGARWHYWSNDPVDYLPNDEVVYKNPPLGTPQHSEGYYRARNLSINCRANTTMVLAARHACIAGNLIAAARKAECQKRNAAAEERAAEARKHVLDGVRWLAREWSIEIGNVSDDELSAVLKTALAAILEKSAR
jgi:hypothetical protein